MYHTLKQESGGKPNEQDQTMFSKLGDVKLGDYDFNPFQKAHE